MIQACPNRLFHLPTESVSLEEVSIPFIRVMSPWPWKWSTSSTSTRSYSAQLISHLYGLKDLFFQQPTGWGWCRRLPGEIPDLGPTIRKCKPAKPATLIIRFRRYRQSIREAKFLSCSGMINLPGSISGNIIRKFWQNFQSSSSTATKLKKTETSPKNFLLPEFTT